MNKRLWIDKRTNITHLFAFMPRLLGFFYACIMHACMLVIPPWLIDYDYDGNDVSSSEFFSLFWFQLFSISFLTSALKEHDLDGFLALLMEGQTYSFPWWRCLLQSRHEGMLNCIMMILMLHSFRISKCHYFQEYDFTNFCSWYHQLWLF